MKKRFGFIERQDSNDVLVHVRAINGLGFTTLPEGHEVEFGVEQGRQGHKLPTSPFLNSVKEALLEHIEQPP